MYTTDICSRESWHPGLTTLICLQEGMEIYLQSTFLIVFSSQMSRVVCRSLVLLFHMMKLLLQPFALQRGENPIKERSWASLGLFSSPSEPDELNANQTTVCVCVCVCIHTIVLNQTSELTHVTIREIWWHRSWFVHPLVVQWLMDKNVNLMLKGGMHFFFFLKRTHELLRKNII